MHLDAFGACGSHLLDAQHTSLRGKQRTQSRRAFAPLRPFFPFGPCTDQSSIAAVGPLLTAATTAARPPGSRAPALAVRCDGRPRGDRGGREGRFLAALGPHDSGHVEGKGALM